MLLGSTGHRGDDTESITLTGTITPVFGHLTSESVSMEYFSSQHFREEAPLTQVEVESLVEDVSMAVDLFTAGMENDNTEGIRNDVHMTMANSMMIQNRENGLVWNKTSVIWEAIKIAG